MSNFSNLRQNMVKGQILPEGVSNPLLIEAFLKIPREHFIPHQLQHIAYMDGNFPLYKDRVLLRPATLAGLLEALNPTPSDKILYIACGTGYGPALLGQIGVFTVALDSEEALTQEAERLFHELDLSTVEAVLGPLNEGWKGGAPYDKIFIEGTTEFIPETLISQLNEGGGIVTLRAHPEQGNKAVRYIKKEGKLTPIPLFDAFAPRLEAFQKLATFVF